MTQTSSLKSMILRLCFLIQALCDARFIQQSMLRPWLQHVLVLQTLVQLDDVCFGYSAEKQLLADVTAKVRSPLLRHNSLFFMYY